MKTEIKIGDRIFYMKSGTPIDDNKKKPINIPERYKNIKFSDLKKTEKNKSTLESLYNYAQKFQEYLNMSIIIIGNVGTGKTTLSYYVLKTVLENGYKGELITSSGIYDGIKDSYNGKVDTEKNYIDKLCNLDLLVIDDLGTEMLNDWRYEKLFTVIDTRYRKRKATIFNSNFDIKELRNNFDERIVSRMMEMSKMFVFKLVDSDWRLKRNDY